MQKTQNFPNDDVDDTVCKHVSQHYGNGLSSFQVGVQNWKDQHTQRKLLNFENW